MDPHAPQSEPAGQHTTVIRLYVPDGQPGHWAQFEPEGGIRDLGPGDELTITMTGESPRKIEIYRWDDGIVIWRPLDCGDISITDQQGQPVTDLW